MAKNKTAPELCTDSQIGFSDVRKIHPALRGYVGYCLHKITTIFKSEINQAFIKEKMHGPHIAILSVIAEGQGDINQMQLCEDTGIDKASMVKAIDHLEKLKFIERVGSREDRRVKNLITTKKGLVFLQQAKSTRTQIERKFFAPLNKEEIETFKNLLLRILDHQSTRK